MSVRETGGVGDAPVCRLRRRLHRRGRANGAPLPEAETWREKSSRDLRKARRATGLHRRKGHGVYPDAQTRVSSFAGATAIGPEHVRAEIGGFSVGHAWDGTLGSGPSAPRLPPSRPALGVAAGGPPPTDRVALVLNRHGEVAAVAAERELEVFFVDPKVPHDRVYLYASVAVGPRAMEAALAIEARAPAP